MWFRKYTQRLRSLYLTGEKLNCVGFHICHTKQLVKYKIIPHKIMFNDSNNTLNSTSVLEIQDLKHGTILHWENELILSTPGDWGDVELYDIILYDPDHMKTSYRLFQMEDIGDAQEKMIYLQEKLVPLIAVIKIRNMLNVQGLESYLSVLNNNPSWTLMHLAAYFNFHEIFKYNSFRTYLNNSDDTGMSPIQVAISQRNLESVQSLVEQKCFLFHKDNKENSVFHYASSDIKILSVLLKDVNPTILNSPNKLGYTPLHLSCLSENYECVKALLLAGADINISFSEKAIRNVNNFPYTISSYITDYPNCLKNCNIKDGGTPLHWISCPEKINQLIDHGCQVNAVDFQKRSALHIMTQNRKFDCIIALLSKEADTNIQDSDGNTALHLAIQFPEDIHILQSLIVFGTDVNILNNNGESPRHLVAKTNNLQALYCLHSVGARRCTLESNNCNDCCHAFGKEDGEAPSIVEGPSVSESLNNMLDVAGMEMVTNRHADETPKKGRLLSLDGGGIKGLILIQMLLELETVIGRPIHHCFDWITGTSTGGILALSLASGRTAKECLGLYFQLKDRIFSGNRPYPSEPLEKALREILGDDTYLRDIQHPKISIPCALADRQPIELFLYRNYQSPDELLKNTNPSEHTLLWEVARATSAAPTYFRPYKNFLDGGLIANNPTLDALTEIQQYNLALRACHRENEQSVVNIVVSLGTGLVPIKNNVQIPESLPGILQLLRDFPSLLSILIDQATAADGRVVERARAWCASVGIPYFRFNPQMSEDVGLNEKCNIKLCRILWETKAYMYANMPKLKEVAHFLNRD